MINEIFSDLKLRSPVLQLTLLDLLSVFIINLRVLQKNLQLMIVIKSCSTRFGYNLFLFTF